MNNYDNSLTNSDQEHTAEHVARIRELNDSLRCTGRGGMVVMTSGVASFDSPTVATIFEAVAMFSAFNEDNDPYGEHDCAILDAVGERIMFKIDYYDRTRTWRSPDPTDPKVTVRVLTVMLASEY